MLNFPRTTHYRKIDHESMVVVLAIDPSIAYSEGCPCYWDAAAKVAKPIPADAGDAIVEMYCGLATQTSPVTHHPRGALTKMSFYIGDVIAKLFFHGGEALDHFTPIFAGNEVGVGTITVAAGGVDRTIPLGHAFIDVEEYKKPRNTTEGEEVSVLLRPSIFKIRNFA